MKRLFSLILCGSAILLTVPTIAEARPRRATRINSGVHRSLPSRSSVRRRSVRPCYNCRYHSPYRQEYYGGYEGRTYDRGYRYYPRSRGRSRIRIEYEGSF